MVTLLMMMGFVFLVCSVVVSVLPLLQHCVWIVGQVSSLILNKIVSYVLVSVMCVQWLTFALCVMWGTLSHLLSNVQRIVFFLVLVAVRMIPLSVLPVLLVIALVMKHALGL